MRLKQTRILIRVEAGGAYGLGHVSRMCTLAAALRSHSTHITFIASNEEIVWHVQSRSGGSIRIYNSRGIDDAVLQHVRMGADLFIYDIPRPPNITMLQAIRATCPVILVDQPSIAPGTCDLALYPNAHISSAQIAELLLTAPQILSGIHHLLLPDELLRLRHVLYADRPPSLVIAGGGTDPELTLPRMAEAITGMLWASNTTILLPQHTTAKSLPSYPGKYVAWNARHLAEARLAVLPLGNTLYETMSLWTPILAWARTTQDANALHLLHAHGIRSACKPLPMLHDMDTWLAQITSAWEDLPWQRDATQQLKTLNIDTDGAKRVAHACMQLITRAKA
jgi:spore coat polysaccharide biosynthesis predicted glycosyltransferase SpsG